MHFQMTTWIIYLAYFFAIRLLHKFLGAQPAVKIIDLKDPLTGEATGTRVEVLIPIMELDR
jgi:hypothetical protein